MVNTIRFGLTLILLLSYPARADFQKAAPWYQSVRHTLEAKGLLNQHLFLKWSSKKSRWQVPNLSQQGFLKVIDSSYLDFLAQRSIDFSLEKKKPDLGALFEVLPIDVITLIKGKTCLAYFRPKSTQMQKEKIRLKKSKGKIMTTYLDALGYNGVVIDQQGDFVLIGAFSSFPRDAQALMLKDSLNKYTVKSSKKQGSGLLQMVDHQGYIGVFEVLVKGDTEGQFLPGSKVLLGEP